MGMAGQQAIVIGGAQATGRALVRALLEAGAEVRSTLAGSTPPALDCDPADAAAFAALAEGAGAFDLAALTLEGAQGDLAGISAAIHGAAAHLIPAMVARGGGALLFVLTLSAEPDPFHEAAAGWLATATAALAARHASERLRVNAVVALTRDAPALPRFMAAAAAAAPPPVPLATLPDPRAVAAAALALCGSEAAAITGQVLRLDGGRAAVTP